MKMSIAFFLLFTVAFYGSPDRNIWFLFPLFRMTSVICRSKEIDKMILIPKHQN